jgi:hypothetical protein
VTLNAQQLEAARQALFAYNDLAAKVNAGEVADEELLAELHAIAALATVAGDPELEQAADNMWESAREGDLAWAGYAPRFVAAVERLVPEHRRPRPG